MNAIVKFPDEHYVGYRPEVDEQTKTLTHYTGFMTPSGKDAAAKKRMESVDRWSEHGSRVSVRYENYRHVYEDSPYKKAAEYFLNEPLEGFRIDYRLNRGGSYYGNQDKWKIDDPRGFQLEITGSNLERIIEYCVIERGEIQGKLIWGREGSNNVLVPVESDIYKKAKANTEISKKKASLKDLQAGDTVQFQNTEVGQYLGSFFLIKREYDDTHFVNYSISKKKSYVFKMADGLFKSIVTPKLAEIISSGTGMTADEINQEVQSIEQSWNRTIFGHVDNYVAVSSSPDLTMTWEFIAVKDLNALIAAGYETAFSPMTEHKIALASVYHIKPKPSIDGWGVKTMNPHTLEYYFTSRTYGWGKYHEQPKDHPFTVMQGLDIILTSGDMVTRIKK